MKNEASSKVKITWGGLRILDFQPFDIQRSVLFLGTFTQRGKCLIRDHDVGEIVLEVEGSHDVRRETATQRDGMAKPGRGGRGRLLSFFVKEKGRRSRAGRVGYADSGVGSRESSISEYYLSTGRVPL